jgi:Amt family ammonium transporter
MRQTFALWSYGLLISLALILGARVGIAQETAQFAERLRALEIAHQATQVNLDTLWVVVASILVLLMQAGYVFFAIGLSDRPPETGALAKRLISLGGAILVFWAIGFGLMFGRGNAWMGEIGWFLISPGENSPTTGVDYTGVFTALNGIGIPLMAKFCFPLTLTGIVAAIVANGVASRMRITAFVWFCMVLIGLPYSIVGHWIWGDGWLERLGFWDFAGATVIHSVGGWIGLVSTLLLGPRPGNYVEVTPAEWQSLPPQVRTYRWPWTSQRPCRLSPNTAHNLGQATLGCLLVWVGWLGFNGGSLWSANGAALTHILVNTIMAGAMGGLGAAIAHALTLAKPNLPLILKGLLGGCVSITAACAYVDIEFAVIIGFCGGFWIALTTNWLAKAQIDDPIGAISVHLGGGIWGTLAVALFSAGPQLYPQYGLSVGPERGALLGGAIAPLGVQLLGIVAVGLFTVLCSFLTWGLLSKVYGQSLKTSAVE